MILIHIILGIHTFLLNPNDGIQFYNQDLNIEQHENLLIEFEPKPKEKSISQFFQKLENRNYEPFMKELINHKQKMRLNDWLFYKLIVSAIDQKFKGKTKNYRIACIGFLLAKYGFDIQVGMTKSELKLYVYTKEKVYAMDRLQIGSRSYHHISSLDFPIAKSKKLEIMEYKIKGEKKLSFSFEMNILPVFDSMNFVSKKIQFSSQGMTYIVNSSINETYVKIMKDYPQVELKKWFDIPLSQEAYDSLIPWFKEIIKDKSHAEAIRIILSFVRQTSDYHEDTKSFGREKFMTAEEVFYYGFGDCEDRSSLFYYLVKELVNVPMVILKYPSHVNIGVDIKSNSHGRPVYHNERSFLVCEPTEVGSDILEVGESQQREKYNPKVIGEYFPSNN